MKCLIILALAVAARAQTFYPQDTPAVSAAKAAHYAEYAKAAALVGADVPPVYKSLSPMIDAQGFVIDTPEVMAARAAHLAEYARIAAAAPAVVRAADPYAEYYRALDNYNYLVRSYYSGNQAMPSGYLADTPAVAHAKATHLYKLYQGSARP